MEISFASLLINDPGLFQEVLVNVATYRVALKVEMYVHVFAETWRIVIAIGFGVTESLQDGVGLNENVFYPFDFLLTVWDKKKYK